MRHALLALLLIAAPALADENTPLDLSKFDPAEVKDFLGKYRVSDETGKRHCNVILSREETIGGMVIDVSPNCAKIFPAMADVAAWRPYDGWQIVFADATRHEMIRFTTPDNAYVAMQNVNGIFTIEKRP